MKIYILNTHIDSMKHHESSNMNRNTRNDKTIYYQHNIEDIDLIQFQKCFRKMKYLFVFYVKTILI